MPYESRFEPRYRVALPLRLGSGAVGSTRDVSASGLFFTSDTEQRLGDVVDLSIELPGGARSLLFRASGEVVRIEQRGAAVRFQGTRLEAG